MYKLSYYRFAEVQFDPHTPAGYDRTRNTEIGNRNIALEHLEEAYTSEHWIVRIYKVNKKSNLVKGKMAAKKPIKIKKTLPSKV